MSKTDGKTEISLKDFNKKIKPIRDDYYEKKNELESLADQFNELANSITLGKNETSEAAEELLSEIAYDFGLEWDGNFEPGEMEFWTPSTC